jgi:outer membrane protein OmpA-like peptidoglycan-associated protein
MMAFPLSGDSIMRRLVGVGLLLSFGACVLLEPSGQRYVVFFQESSAQMTDSGRAVLVAAADRAKRHPNAPVVIVIYADPYGSQPANAGITRLRGQVVYDGLVTNGVPPTHIARRETGSVNFQLDSQESRRVEIIVGNP